MVDGYRILREGVAPEVPEIQKGVPKVVQEAQIEPVPKKIVAGTEDIAQAKARRTAILLKLGGNPTRQDLLVELRSLNDSLGKLRDDRMAIQRSEPGVPLEDRAERLRQVEENIARVERYRDDLGMLSSEAMGSENTHQDVIGEPETESPKDVLRNQRSALQKELDGLGFFAFLRKREIQANMREIDRETAKLTNARRNQEAADADRNEAIAAK
ncbi:MAG: hypothetical protein AAB473_03475 [Patescibacteria group bacterium]